MIGSFGEKTVARRTFFSFHYRPDVHRAMVVRNSWVTKADREDSGFFDSSVFESKQRNDDALKAFLLDGLKNTSVTCVLIGAETSLRRWVRFEIFRSFMRGNGLFGIQVGGIKNLRQETCGAGGNPFSALAFTIEGDRLKFQEYMATGWQWARDVGSMPMSEVAYDMRGMTNHTLSNLFPVYEWIADGGFENLGDWIESAAGHAGKLRWL